MSTLPTLLFAIALPKRFNFTARVYRRAHRAYAFIRGIKDPEITMNGPRVAIVLFFTSGGVIGIIVGLLTLLIP